MSAQDKNKRLGLALDINQRADAADAEKSLSEEPSVETEWGTASVDSSAPEVLAMRETLRQAQAEQEFEDSTIGEIALSALQTGNFVGKSAYKSYLSVIANTERDYDPNFDAKTLLTQDSMFYNDEDKTFLLGAESARDYNYRKQLLNDRDMSQAKLARLGGYGDAAMLAAGIFDIDMLMPAGKAATYTVKANKLKGALKYAKNGSEMAHLKSLMRANKAKKYADVAFTAGWQNAATAALERAQGEHITIDDIAGSAMMGVALSPIVTAMSSKLFDVEENYKYNDEVLNTLFEREGALQTGRESIFDQITKEPKITTLYNIARAKDKLYQKRDAKGQALKEPKRLELNNVYPDAPKEVSGLKTPSKRIKDIIEASYILNREKEATRAEAYRNIPDFEQKLIKSQAFDKVANTVTGKPRYTEGTESGNIVLEAATHEFISDPTNFVSNVNNADFISDQVRTKSKSFIQDAENTYYKNYMKAYTQGMEKTDAFKNEFLGTYRDKFVEEVQLEAQARRHGKHFSEDPDVNGYVDSLQKISDYMVDELNDVNHGGVDRVSGTEDLQKIPYVPRRWSERRIRLKQGDLGEGEILSKFSEAICRGFKDMGADVTPDKAKIFAKAILHNALHRDTSKPYNTSLSNEFAVEQLVGNGLSIDEANKLVSTIFQTNEGKSAPKFTKFRIPMDYSVQLSDGSTIASLLDSDLQKTMNGYINNASGRVGLARVGIHSDAEFSALEEAADFMDGELKKKGAIIKKPAKQQLQDMKNLLLGYPLSADSPWATRLTNLGNWVMMWKAGVTQLIEFAPQMAAFGIENTIGDSLRVIKAMFKNGERVELLDDVASFTGSAFFDDYTMGALNIENLDMDNIPKSHWFWEMFDHCLKKGLEVQQVLNLMKPVITLQRKAAVCSMMNRLNNLISEGGFDNIRSRLSDWGITGELFDKVSAEWKKHAQVSADGKRVENLHLNEWDVRVAEEFMRSVRRAMDSLIMKPHLGEQRGWISTSAGRLIAQFKNYPLLALNKFTTAGLRHMDAQTLNTFLISLTLAPLVYAAKVQLTTADPNERANKMAFDKVVYNSLSYNVNLGSFADPVSIIGDLMGIKTSPYSRGEFDAAGYVMPSLNVLPALAAPVKASVQKLTKGELNKQTFSQLQQATVLGNMLLMSRFYEAAFGAPLSRDAKKIQKNMSKVAGSYKQKALNTKVEKRINNLDPEKRLNEKKQSAIEKLEKMSL